MHPTKIKNSTPDTKNRFKKSETIKAAQDTQPTY
jgi:hypothetical protein